MTPSESHDPRIAPDSAQWACRDAPYMGSPDARRAFSSLCDHRRLQPLARGRLLRGSAAASLSSPPPVVATLPPLASRPSPVVALLPPLTSPPSSPPSPPSPPLVSPPSSSPSSSPPPSSPASPPLVAASLPSSLASSHVARTPSSSPCRQACRYRVVGTLHAVVLALALPWAPLPRAYRAVASTGRVGRARLARLRLIHHRLVRRRLQRVVQLHLPPSPHHVLLIYLYKSIYLYLH